MEKTREMYDRAEGKDLCWKDVYSMLYSMREFSEEFLNWDLDFDLTWTGDWETFLLCTSYLSVWKFDWFSVVINRCTKYDFESRDEFVWYMVDYLYWEYEKAKSYLIIKDEKWENSTK